MILYILLIMSVYLQSISQYIIPSMIDFRIEIFILLTDISISITLSVFTIYNYIDYNNFTNICSYIFLQNIIIHDIIFYTDSVTVTSQDSSEMIIYHYSLIIFTSLISINLIIIFVIIIYEIFLIIRIDKYE